MAAMQCLRMSGGWRFTSTGRSSALRFRSRRSAADPEESTAARAALAQSGRLARQPPTPPGNGDPDSNGGHCQPA
jgi:hypothetical protein